jgi:predicted lysophospholipase L1 biosynthesis ABC-type transport system permease subunit
MARRRNAADERRRRKMITVLWVSLLALSTIILIYKEHTALLYILATLGITALLVVVAMADLGHAEKLTNEPRRGDGLGTLGGSVSSGVK